MASSDLHSFEVMGTTFKIDKKYAPIKALGKGAYGVVCAAKNKETGSKVAIKKITPMCATSTDGKHTLREIRLMRWLGKHPNIISLKDLCVDMEEDTLYVCMELMDTDLHKVIQSQQGLTDAHYKHFMYQLLLGLRFAHRYGVIHRDLKPANLLVTKACDLVISDFGLARQMPGAQAGAAFMTEHVVTRWYRAPELMLSADGCYTPAIDIWSVGCILAELLGRNPLFAGKDFMETLRLQIDVLGTRPAEELEYIRSDQALQFLAGLPARTAVPWKTLFPEASEKCLDLLNGLLQFHPSKRLTVDSALAHPYFDSVRAQYTTPDPVLPEKPGAFDFSFEGADLSATDFRRLIVEEAASFRAEKELARRLRQEKDKAAGSGTGSSASGSREEDQDMSVSGVTDGAGASAMQMGSKAVPQPAQPVAAGTAAARPSSGANRR